MTAEQHPTSAPVPRLVLCAAGGALAFAWRGVTGAAAVHHGSVLDADADAVVSPANSYGRMRDGVDAVYARGFPGIEERVRSAVLATHGGELPVGEALLVPTGAARPAWLVSAPTVREPGERLAEGTVHPYLAARAVFLLWRDGASADGTPVRRLVRTVAMPGLGAGSGADEADCARQVDAAWRETFDVR